MEESLKLPVSQILQSGEDSNGTSLAGLLCGLNGGLCIKSGHSLPLVDPKGCYNIVKPGKPPDRTRGQW